MKRLSLIIAMFMGYASLISSCTKHDSPAPVPIPPAEIKKIPTAPTIGTATAGDASASVTFTIPTSDGGSPITTYTVISNLNNLTATGSSSPIVISNLINGTAYTFSVIATNAVGPSTPSGPSNAIIPANKTMLALNNSGSAWKFVKNEGQPHIGDPWLEYVISDCQKKEKLYFDLDLKYRTVAVTGCTAAAPSGFWKLNSDSLLMWGGGQSTITILTPTDLQIVLPGTNLDGSKNLTRHTYIKE
jgi:hypothetical protein